METVRQLSLVGLTASALLLCSSAGGFAQSPVQLNDGQLDRITAGGATVFSSSDAQAAAAFALTNTGSSSFVIADASPYPGQPNLGPTAGVSEGTALATASNVTVPGQPPPASSTSVQTGGVADGNLVVTSTVNHTAQGAGGVTFTVGWTVVYGAWVGL